MNQENRIKSFNDIDRAILNQENATIEFTEPEKETYRWFANGLISIFSKIESSSQYVTDIDRIIERMENIYKKNLLEEYLQNSADLTRCFVSGEYRYPKTKTIRLSCLKGFIDLLKKNPKEKQRIIINNLHNRIDTIDRYDKLFSDDIPF